MTQFTQILLNSLVLSADYILLALGLTLIFGILRVLNFAHGTLYVLGAYVVYTLTTMAGVHYLLAALIGMAVVSIVGILLEAGLLYPLSKRMQLASVAAVLGVSMVIEGILAFIYESEDVAIESFFAGTVSLAGATLSRERIMVLVICTLVMIGVYLWIQKTRQGVAIRAMAENPAVAGLQGVNIRTMRFLVMAIASGLAAFAGAMITPLFYLNPYLGGGIVFKALLIVAVGGMGSINGSILAGLLFGFVESIGVTFFGPLAEVVTFLMVMVIFIFRPQGLLGVHYELH